MFTKNRKKLIKSLHQKKYRDLHGLFLVEGEKMVRELIDLKSDGLSLGIEDIYVSKNCKANFPEAEEISIEDMQSISAFKTSPGIIAIVTQPKSSQLILANQNEVLILDEIKDPGNLGTIIRSAEWFGIQTIIISPHTVETYNPKTVQSTMGSLFRTTVIRMNLEEAFNILRELNFSIYAADMNGIDTRSLKWDVKKALVIGSEAHGISEVTSSYAKHIVSIAGKGKAESLNAGVAASIILSHW